MQIVADFKQFQAPEDFEWFQKDYQTTVRKFQSGLVEVETHVIRAMSRIAISERWLRFNPVSMRPKEEEELTEEEMQRKAEENKARAVRRARQRLRWLIKAAGADHLLTLTYRDIMDDLDRLKKDWKAFVRLVRARYPDWQFVCIRELQDRGAFHLHVAVVGRQDIKYIRRCWYKVLGASPDAQGEETPGQIDVRGPSKRWGGKGYQWKADKLAGYLGKYLHKCFDQETDKGAKRYWASREIELPEAQKIWLGATSFPQAVEMTHDLARALGVQNLTMWASESYASIWMSG